MLDPVTGFKYPKSWQEKCTSIDHLEDVASGLSVLTSSGKILRRGYTTGTTAAAACKAATLSLKSEVSCVRILIPCGIEVDVPVVAKDGRASCRKYAGDYHKDMTAGLEFIAEASLQDIGIDLVTGVGIGTFIRDTARFKSGVPAITPGPLSCILQSIEEALNMTNITGVSVTLSAPLGVEVAKKTLNFRVGVERGISVLGSTGLVEPWDDHLTESILDRISASNRVVLTTGRIGLRYSRLSYPNYEVVLIGSKIDDALDVAKGEVILFGLPALILKHINPNILDGTGYKTIEEFSNSPKFGNIVRKTLYEFSVRFPLIKVVLINRQGTIIGGR
ncbi:MAG: cobalt-precorrin-5B (C(1))-methyltransferase [Methanoregulaceae archaeon]|jgi:cobalt-precorrin-5B (C1)-methyltransferase